MFHVLYPDASFRGAPDIEQEVVGADGAIEVHRIRSGSVISAESWARADAVIMTRMSFGEAELARAPRCRIVVRMGVGYDTVDLEACGRRGVAVCNVPDYGTTDVADHAIAMMLTLARGTACYNDVLRSELAAGWRYDAPPTVRRLRGLTCGVIGLGAIGTAAALRAQAFGMEVRFYDPYILPGRDLALGFTREMRLQSLLGAADVVTIHAPLSEETRSMIDATAIGQMKEGALLINAARGPIVDTAAVLDGLKSGRLGGVGLDVLPKEPLDLADPLIAAWHADEPWIKGRVILSPHAAFYSAASFVDQRRKSIETAWRYLREGVLLNCVNTASLRRNER
ncbi:MAG: C-terminal binding protein [Alphaproteobacteria bacterium]|nr:C-terminal binding protein [Alphaproteobacteria bacterium]